MTQQPRWSGYIVPEDESALLRATFGEALCRARRERGWSMAELSRRAGVSASHISNLERGLRRPRPSFLRSLAMALDPEGFEDLAAELGRQAGDSLRPDTLPGERRRERRNKRAEEQLPDLRKKLASLLARAQKTQVKLEGRAVGAQTEAEILAEIGRRDRAFVRAQQSLGSPLDVLERAFMARRKSPSLAYDPELEDDE